MKGGSGINIKFCTKGTLMEAIAPTYVNLGLKLFSMSFYFLFWDSLLRTWLSFCKKITWYSAHFETSCTNLYSETAQSSADSLCLFLVSYTLFLRGRDNNNWGENFLKSWDFIVTFSSCPKWNNDVKEKLSCLHGGELQGLLRLTQWLGKALEIIDLCLKRT